MSVDAQLIMNVFNKIHSAVSKGMAIKSAITTGAALCDGGASALADWLLTKMISLIVGATAGDAINATILAVAITLEYRARTGKLKFLKNKCSNCHMKGHNRSNCPGGAWKTFAGKFAGSVTDAAIDSLDLD